MDSKKKTPPPRTTGNPAYSHGILGKFLHLAGAQWIRDGLHTVFLIYLARQSTSDYGEFMVAFGLASIILFLGEFGLNQPLVASLSKKFTHKGDILAQYTLLKSGILTAGWLGVLVFVLWQDYTPGLTNLVLVISAGVGLEALASPFFVALRGGGRRETGAGDFPSALAAPGSRAEARITSWPAAAVRAILSISFSLKQAAASIAATVWAMCSAPIALARA